MNRLFGADGLARLLANSIGDDLIGVHVGGRTGSGLEDIEDEVVVEIAFDHFLGGDDNGLG